MGSSSSKTSLEPVNFDAFKSVESFDLDGFYQALNSWLAPWRMECTKPWQVGWYNSTRDETAGGLQRIDTDDECIAFAICSLPGYLDVVAEHYARSRPDGNFVDAATNEIVELLKAKLPEELGIMLMNTDEGPPYYHVQTIGWLAGNDQHLQEEDIDDADWKEDTSAELEETRDPKMWGTDPEMRRKIFSVNVNPKYGGWYSYRMLLVLSKVKSSSLAKPLERPPVQNFVKEEDAKRILEEYNVRHELCLWRNISDSHPYEDRYKPEEFFYFTETKPAKRKQFLELKAAQFAEVPKLRA